MVLAHIGFIMYTKGSGFCFRGKVDRAMARDTMTVGEARDYLGVGKRKMADLTKKGGLLPTTPDPLDGRIKLVRRADVEKLREQSAKKAAA